VFVPTQPIGRESRQGAIRLKNLLGLAESRLTDAGMLASDAERFLAPAHELEEDPDLWQHQSIGLAVFVDNTGARHFTLPITVPEIVVVGPRFHITPLLPLFDADGDYRVLTLTAEHAHFYTGSRFTFTEQADATLTADTASDEIDSDYQNPVQASPTARRGVHSFSTANAQVYGDSPPEWRKTRLLDFIGHVAKSVDHMQAADPLPLVIVADPECSGHIQAMLANQRLIAGAAELNPSSLALPNLHKHTLEVMHHAFTRGKSEAIEKAAALMGRGDSTVLSRPEDVVRAAYDGRVTTLVVAEGENVWGRFDPSTEASAPLATSESMTEDLLDSAAAYTLQQGGTVFVAPHSELPTGVKVAAVLRY
jgi:hypothetical protein